MQCEQVGMLPGMRWVADCLCIQEARRSRRGRYQPGNKDPQTLHSHTFSNGIALDTKERAFKLFPRGILGTAGMVAASIRSSERFWLCHHLCTGEEMREPWLCWYGPRPSSHPDSLTTAVDQQEQHQQCQSSPTKPLRFWCTRIRPGGREGHQASTL